VGLCFDPLAEEVLAALQSVLRKLEEQ
jgi:hypothetical protein